MKLALRLILISTFATFAATACGTVKDDADAGPTGEVCDDGVDNDGDGMNDCADPDCAGAVVCIEDCTNGTDDDGDGETDCADSDCSADAACQEICDDGDDNDLDGDTDCADSDCDGAANGCPEACDDGRDNDGDGDTDCADTDCIGNSACPEICDDNVDNDGDLATDCLDPDCFDEVGCAVLYVADGRAGVVGNLYSVDPTNATITGQVALDVGLTGMSFSPTRVLYGSQSIGRGGGGKVFGPPLVGNLVTIDRATGVSTVVGPLVDAGGGTHYHSPDITFVGASLFGWTENGDMPTSIEIVGDTTPGLVTTIGPRVSSAGSGMATRADGTVFWIDDMRGTSGQLYSIDVTTGAATALGLVTSDNGNYQPGNINSMTFHEGTLYGVHIVPPAAPAVFGGPSGSEGTTELVAIDVATLKITIIGPLPDGIDAIASTSL